MEPKFGKVYVVKREITPVATEVAKQRLLESISFSNIDHKWYDSEGKLSPLYKEYEGRPVSIQFKIKQQDKDGKEVEFQAKLNLPFKLGEREHQDFEGVPMAQKRMIERWESRGILSGDVENDSGYRVVESLQGAASVASFCPGYKISQMRVLHTAMDPFFILDDHIDKSTSQKEMPFKLGQLYWSGIDDLLEGKNDTIKQLKLPHQYLKLYAGMEEMRDVIHSKKKPLRKYLLSAYREYHAAINFETSREWKQKQSDRTSLMYRLTSQELRLLTVGARLTLEMISFDQDLQIDDKIRESFLFESILRAYGKQVSLVNDLVSLKKEMGVDGTSNTVILFHVEYGLPLEEALQKAVDEINFWTQVVNETGELLINLYGEYEETRKLVNIMRNLIAGNIQWIGITKRYHQNLIYDCVID